MFKRIIQSVILILVISSCADKHQKKIESEQKSGILNDEYTVLTDSSATEVLDQWLKIYIDETEIVNRLGNPEKVGKIEFWDALGTYVQKWEFPSKGIELEMESESKHALKTVKSISITDPCTYQTSRGLQVGSPIEDIYTNYKELIDQDFSDDTLVVIGNIYNGTVFEITDSKISKIFIGSIAE